MRKIPVLLLVLALLTGCFAYAEETADVFTKDVYVLYTSDIHCGIESGFGMVGVDVIRTNLEKDNYVLLVDDGDSYQGEPVGTMTSGKAIIDLMNAVGYDIAAIGNHEFDYGMDRFFELKDMASFPYISCNFTKDGAPVLDPYVIKEFDGVKIAFVGVSTPKTLTSSTPKYFQDEEGNFVYGFCQSEDGALFYETVQAAVDAARAEGAQYVVAMAHLGDEAEAVPYTYYDLIVNTTGIDALLDGHSHDTEQVEMTNKDGETVLRTACGTKLECVGYLKIAKDGTLSTGLYKWGDKDHNAQQTFGFETDVAAAVTDATAELNEALAEVVATTEQELYIYDPEAVDENGKAIRIVRSQETNLGDLCADAYRVLSGADVAFVNGGGIRVSMAAGAITRNDILKVHPFGNSMCVIEVTGQTILDALEYSVHSLPGEFGGFLQVSGLAFDVDLSVPSSVVIDENSMFVGVEGDYRVKNVMIGDEPLDPEKTYTLASHNYKLKNHGDGYTQFDGCTILQDEVMLDNQVLLTYITDVLGGTVGADYADPYGQGRITILE